MGNKGLIYKRKGGIGPRNISDLSKKGEPKWRELKYGSLFGMTYTARKERQTSFGLSIISKNTATD